jgi:pimeloyl-ACP methyl ester carboxylesterase
MFGPQKAAFPALRVPAWIKPDGREPLAQYARRFAESVDPGCPCYLGGASFGGVLALEMAPYLRTQAVFLIGSVRSPAGMHACLRALRPFARLTPSLPFALLAPLAGISLRQAGRYSSPTTRGLLRHLTEADPSFLHWGAQAVLTWRPSSGVNAPVYQIHGERDPVFPARLAAADEIVPGGGHLLTLTHGAAVNSFLSARMQA